MAQTPPDATLLSNVDYTLGTKTNPHPSLAVGALTWGTPYKSLMKPNEVDFRCD